MRILVLGLVVLALVGLAQVEPGECAGSPKQPRRQQTVYNHTTTEGAPLDALVHKFYQTNFKIVDINGKGFVSAKVSEGTTSPDKAITDTGEKLAGSVLVVYLITDQGRVIYPIVVESTDERLNPTALRAMEAWRFRPATLNGKAVWSAAAQEFIFEK
ncbi:MAG: TonB family protein [Desulfobaccales bacterium]